MEDEDGSQVKISTETHACPLCQAAKAGLIHRDRHRDYFRCPRCSLAFVPPVHFLSVKDEKAEYDWHRNAPDDEGYRRFLSRLLVPLGDLLRPGSQGLDFGSGPGPTLSLMLAERGHSMAVYDPHYAPDPPVLERQYDFITATEVVEHLHDPRGELNRLWSALKPGGWLGIMTKLVKDNRAFRQWHYINDLTHVCFFSRATFEWLADQWQARLTFVGNDVILLNKPP